VKKMQARNSNNPQGVDVSHHQGNIDWQKVKEAGMSFAFIKSTEGVGYEDPLFAKNYKEAKEAGLITGAYHYATPSTMEDAVAEADYFIETITKYGGFQQDDLPPALDLEEDKGLDQDQLSSWARKWIERVKEKIGRQPIIYTYKWFAQTKLNESLNDIPLWFARYGVNQPEDSGGWTQWTFLQYSSKGSVSGIKGNVDLNEFDGSFEQTEGDSPASTEPTQPPFPDVPADHWALEAIEFVKKQGIMSGYPDSTFGPDDPVTRAQLATVIARMMKE
jgi:lysozyme